MCRAEDVDADDRPTHTTRSYRRGTGVWADALESLAVSNRVRAPGIVVRRSAYERAGGYRTDLPHAADWEMWTRLAALGPVVFVDEVLAAYRRHAASDTSGRVRTGENVRERVRAIGVVLAHVARTPPPRARPARAGVRRRVRGPDGAAAAARRRAGARRPPAPGGAPLRPARRPGPGADPWVTSRRPSGDGWTSTRRPLRRDRVQRVGGAAARP